ncbi:MAG: glycoside hydrolase family 127 protein [Oscillospiraceae bacterium]|nr:glycoside hydrolase family 127 protein [Oscillospiraceae bacterium]
MRKAVFPATLYLPERAALAMHSLSSIIDPESGLPFCLFDVMSDPPKMEHTCFDWSDHTARVIDALLLGRALTGSGEADGVVDGLFESLKKGFGADGLHYTPENEWTSEQANMHYQRSVINALLSLCLERQSAEAEELLRGLIDGLYEISVKREDFWYFPAVEYLPGGWFRGDWKILGYGTDPANTNGRLLFGLCRAWELTKNEKAAELARMFVNHIMHHSSAFLPDGSFATGMEFREGHFHSRAVTILGVIRYAFTFGDAEVLAWGKKVYDKALSYGTGFGWYPERLVRERAHGCETCAVVDMMESAIWLAKSGYPEYWETAERILRNQLVESQVTSLDQILKARERSGVPTPDEKLLLPFVGGFAGWSEPNDLLSKVMHNWDLYLCCCAQGVRGCFNAWTHTVERDDDVTRLQLLINYMDEQIQIRSWLPDAGRITVTCAYDTTLEVRTPSWIQRESLRGTISGQPTTLSLANGYLSVALPAGEELELCFKMDEWETEEPVLETVYRVSWKGSSVQGISPEGIYIPLYNRHPEEPVPMVERSAFPIAFHL